MKRWSRRQTDFIENPRIDAFLAEIIDVCVRHRLVLGHEDSQGAFEVDDLDDDCVGWRDWLQGASDMTGDYIQMLSDQ